MHSITAERLEELFQNLEEKEIAVIGDVMLDRYFWGKVSRISPEAPVPVIDIESESFHLGGAANVAANLRSLGAEVLLCGAIGKDNSGKLFCDIMEKSSMTDIGLYADEVRPTTVKTRIIGNNQQIARLDRETRTSINEDIIRFFIGLLNSRKNLSGIILEDYNKGVITKALIDAVREFAAEKKVPVFVDPKFDNFFEYKSVTVFKPNRKEAAEALGFALDSDSDIRRAGQTLLERLDCDNVLLTLGSDGMMLFEKNGELSSVPTKARHIADVSGAGDTVVATLSAMLAAGANIREAATLANIAAGVVCEEPGIVSITPGALRTGLESL